jgi:hypothetical protein
MLFGRLRVPVERASIPDPRDRHESGFHVLGNEVRGEAPQSDPGRTVSPRLSLVPAGLSDEFAGLDRLDRDELDED